jgi:hypothetical protein
MTSIRVRVLSNSTPHDASKFAGPHEIPYAPVHNSKLVHSDPTDAGLDQLRRGLHAGVLNL